MLGPEGLHGAPSGFQEILHPHLGTASTKCLLLRAEEWRNIYDENTVQAMRVETPSAKYDMIALG
jgi:hypothetical protein